MTFNAEEVYRLIGNNKIPFNEEIHCPMILRVMNDPERGTHGHFCAEAMIDEGKFYWWLKKHDVFRQCYGLGKMLSKVNWELEGKRLLQLDRETTGCQLEYWRICGWARYGIGNNSKVRLQLDSKSNPSEHYSQLIAQAAEGEFTASEIKQLMEAINVGLNAHQVFELQKEIDQLKSDVNKMNELNNGQNFNTNQSIEKTN